MKLRSILPWALLLAGAGIASLVVWFLVRPGETPGPPAGDSPKEPTHGRIDPSGGELKLGGVRLTIPRGAVAREREVTVVVAPDPHPPLDKNLSFASPVYRIQAGEGRFEEPVQVALPYDPSRLPPGIREDQLMPVWWNGRDYLSPSQYRVDSDRKEVLFDTTHFSDWGVVYLVSSLLSTPAPPEDPFVLKVAQQYSRSVSRDDVEWIRRRLLEAYARITGSGPLQFQPPPADRGVPLEVIVTDISPYAGVAVDDRLIKVHYDEKPGDTLHGILVHEFFHCVQFGYFRRNARGGEIDVPQLQTNMFWLMESTADWFADELVPTRSMCSFPDFCFEELFLNSQVAKLADPNWKGRENHQYASAIFIKYLVRRFGVEVVEDFLSGAFRKSNFERPLVEEALRDLGSSLPAAYRAFVREHLFAKSFLPDPQRWNMGKPGELNLPNDGRVVAMALKEGEETQRTFAGKAYQVPCAFRFTYGGAAESSASLELELTSNSPGATWMWVFLRPAGGGPISSPQGDADRIKVSWKGVDEAIVVPVSTEEQSLVLTARIAKEKQWKLSAIEVDRSYRRWGYWEEGQAIKPGIEKCDSGRREFEFGWSHSWGENGKNRGVAQVKLAGLPPTVEPGSKVSLSATVKTDWKIAGYMEIASPSLTVEGDAGRGGWVCTDDPFEEGYWAKQDDKGRWQTGTWTKSASLEVSNTVGVPAQSKSFQIHIQVRLDQNGSDHHGEMSVTFTYKRG